MTGTISRFWTLFSVLSGPVVWMLHFVLVWAVAEMGCGANYANMPILPAPAIRTIVIGATVIALIAGVVGGVASYRHWASLRGDGITDREARIRFVLQIGMALSVVFVVSVVLTALPVFFLDACDTAV